MSNLSDIARAQSRLGTGWGFAVMLLGILAMMAPFISGVAVTSLVAVFITAAGLAMTVYAFKAGSFGKGLLQFLFGGITVLCGIAMFVTPILSMFGLTGLLMAYFVVDGLFAIISGVRGRPQPGWGWSIAMLGMLGDATVDVVEDAVEEAAGSAS
jgi:uncharacterized membrane protein HdeD (DUF308 family)